MVVLMVVSPVEHTSVYTVVMVEVSVAGDGVLVGGARVTIVVQSQSGPVEVQGVPEAPGVPVAPGAVVVPPTRAVDVEERMPLTEPVELLPEEAAVVVVRAEVDEDERDEDDEADDADEADEDEDEDEDEVRVDELSVVLVDERDEVVLADVVDEDAGGEPAFFWLNVLK